MTNINKNRKPTGKAAITDFGNLGQSAVVDIERKRQSAVVSTFAAQYCGSIRSELDILTADNAAPNDKSFPVERGVQATRGHLSANGGLRGHSVGGTFPVIMSMVGTMDNLHHLVTAPDGASLSFKRRENALAAANAWLEGRKHTDGAHVARYALERVKATELKNGDVVCECVSLAADCTFFSIYAVNEDGESHAIYDTASNSFGDWLDASLVHTFLLSRTHS